jgi:hypothetical protein
MGQVVVRIVDVDALIRVVERSGGFLGPPVFRPQIGLGQS